MAQVAAASGRLLYARGVLRLLEGPAAVVWDHIDDVTSVAHVADQLADSVGGDGREVRREVVTFLGELAREGLVDVVSAPAEPGYLRPPEVGFTLDEGIGLLVDLRDGRRRMLTDTATQVWMLVCELHYASDVVARLRSRFLDAPPSMDAEARTLLADLVGAGLLREWRPPGQGGLEIAEP